MNSRLQLFSTKQCDGRPLDPCSANQRGEQQPWRHSSVTRYGLMNVNWTADASWHSSSLSRLLSIDKQSLLSSFRQSLLRIGSRIWSHFIPENSHQPSCQASSQLAACSRRICCAFRVLNIVCMQWPPTFDCSMWHG